MGRRLYAGVAALVLMLTSVPALARGRGRHSAPEFDVAAAGAVAVIVAAGGLLLARRRRPS